MSEFDLVITGAELVDGTGSKKRLADVAVAKNKIAAIAAPGELSGHSSIDARGQILSPGFVDIHSHADYTILLDGRGHSSVLQGVTSLAVGNCGSGVAPVSELSEDLVPMNAFGWRKDSEMPLVWRKFSDYIALLRDRGVGPNVFPFVAHGPLRLAVAGSDDRALTRSESIAMGNYLHEAMSAGAVGFSTGLEYSPGISAPQSELVELASAARDFHGVYATHCRNRSDAMDKAAEEAVTIALAGNLRLQMSHFIKRPYASADVAERSWRVLDSARDAGLSVFADVFPFDYGPTPLSVLIPPGLRASSRQEMATRLREPKFREQIFAGLGGMFEAAVKADMVRTMFVADDGADSSMVGLSLADVAKHRDSSAAEAAYWLLENAGENFGCVTIVENWVRWDDLLSALADRRFLIMGDGVSGTLDGPGAGHQFALADWGYAPRFLSQFVRDLKIVTLEDAIHRMTDLPAHQLGLSDRGSIEVGKAADLVVFDLAAIGTAVSPSRLKELPTGISHVLINGSAVVSNGRATNACPGVVGLH